MAIINLKAKRFLIFIIKIIRNTDKRSFNLSKIIAGSTFENGKLYFSLSRIALIPNPEPPGVAKNACDSIQHFESTPKGISRSIWEQINRHLINLIKNIGNISKEKIISL